MIMIAQERVEAVASIIADHLRRAASVREVEEILSRAEAANGGHGWSCGGEITFLTGAELEDALAMAQTWAGMGTN